MEEQFFSVFAMSADEWYTARSAAEAIAAMCSDYGCVDARELRANGYLGADGAFPRLLTDAEMDSMRLMDEDESSQTVRESLDNLAPVSAQRFCSTRD